MTESSGKTRFFRKGNEQTCNETGRSLRVTIAADGGLLLHSEAGGNHRIRTVVLERSVLGFNAGKPASFKVHYRETGRTVYSYYKGGKFWLPAYPPDIPKPSGVQTIDVTILSPSEFVKGFSGYALENVYGLRWMPDRVTLSAASFNNSKFEVNFSQTPKIEGVSEFILKGTSTGSLGWNADGTYLQFQISGLFDQSRTLRIYHKGHGEGWMSIQGNMGFERICLISFDGFRLRLVTKAGREFSAVTLYSNDPSAMYELDNTNAGIHFTINGTSRRGKLIRVAVRRDLENKLLRSVATYAHGRLGAEIAYAIATKELGLENVTLSEPSLGGKDLHTLDGTTVIQARLLTEPAALRPDRLKQTLRIQVAQLMRKIGQDFANNPRTDTGYAILSYLDPTRGSIVATVWEIRINR